MLNKCITTRATLIVPDIEDSVPPHEKGMARTMIRDKLEFIRSNVNPHVVITPRTNAPAIDGGQFLTDDVLTVITKETIKYVDGICVPKVDTL